MIAATSPGSARRRRSAARPLDREIVAAFRRTAAANPRTTRAHAAGADVALTSLPGKLRLCRPDGGADPRGGLNRAPDHARITSTTRSSDRVLDRVSLRARFRQRDEACPTVSMREVMSRRRRSAGKRRRPRRSARSAREGWSCRETPRKIRLPGTARRGAAALRASGTGKDLLAKATAREGEPISSPPNRTTGQQWYGEREQR